MGRKGYIGGRKKSGTVGSCNAFCRCKLEERYKLPNGTTTNITRGQESPNSDDNKEDKDANAANADAKVQVLKLVSAVVGNKRF